MASDQPPAYHALAPAAAPAQPYYQQQQQQTAAVVIVPGQPAYAQPVPNQTVVVVQQHPSVGVNSAANILLNGLCNCFDDVGTCMLAWLCPPCANGINADRVQIGSCCLCCLCYLLFPPCTGAYVRGKLFDMSGAPNPGFCTNFCCHCCCQCCVLAQEGRATNVLKQSGIIMTRA